MLRLLHHFPLLNYLVVVVLLLLVLLLQKVVDAFVQKALDRQWFAILLSLEDFSDLSDALFSDLSDALFEWLERLSCVVALKRHGPD